MVKLPSARRNGPRKRLSKAISKAHRNIKNLQLENEELRKKVKTTQRRMQRLKQKQTCLTPRSKTDKMLKQLQSKGNGKHLKHVRRQLLMSNVLSAEIERKIKQSSQHKKRSIYGSLVGKLVRK